MHMHVKMHHRIVVGVLVAILAHVCESESLVRPFKSIKAPKGKSKSSVRDLLYTLSWSISKRVLDNLGFSFV